MIAHMAPAKTIIQEVIVDAEVTAAHSAPATSHAVPVTDHTENATAQIVDAQNVWRLLQPTQHLYHSP